MSDIFFLIGAPCSATTAYAKIFDVARNAKVYIEQPPKLRVESRELYEGRLVEPLRVLLEAREKNIASILEKGVKYGDKNPCYLPFVPYLYEIWDCKIVFLTRNPKEVLRSMLSYHAVRDGVFTLREDDITSTRSDAEDPWDYSRLRPRAGDEMRERWQSLPFIEKAAWYWATYNRMIMEFFEQFGRTRCIVLDASANSLDELSKAFVFLGLAPFDESSVQGLLAAKINSTKEKIGNEPQVPAFEFWSRSQKEAVRGYVSDVATSLGYVV